MVAEAVHLSGPGGKAPGFILVTHGEIGASLLATAEYILGRKLANFIAVKIPFMSELGQVIGSDCPAPFAERRRLIKEWIGQARKEVDGGNGIIVLADLLGGTSFTAARELLAPGGAIIISGINLPMLLKAAELKNISQPQAVAAELVERSRRAIVSWPDLRHDESEKRQPAGENRNPSWPEPVEHAGLPQEPPPDLPV